MSARLRAIAAETVDIIERGSYRSPAGLLVDIREAVAVAVAGTRMHLPTDELSVPGPMATPAIEVSTESTLEAGRRLGRNAAVLVFASARNPGGGFLNGARSQEEDIARASALYACQRTVPEFYAHHRTNDDLRYSDRVIYSPTVPVFRDETGTLLEQPYNLSMLTSAAPNLGAILTNRPHVAQTVPAAIAPRAERVLRVAATHRHRSLVLGAWGCGVFGNSPAVVAAAFRAAITAVPAFDRIVFAILDRTGDGPTYRTFTEIFAPG